MLKDEALSYRTSLSLPRRGVSCVHMRPTHRRPPTAGFSTPSDDGAERTACGLRGTLCRARQAEVARKKAQEEEEALERERLNNLPVADLISEVAKKRKVRAPSRHPVTLAHLRHVLARCRLS